MMILFMFHFLLIIMKLVKIMIRHNQLLNTIIKIIMVIKFICVYLTMNLLIVFKILMVLILEKQHFVIQFLFM